MKKNLIVSASHWYGVVYHFGSGYHFAVISKKNSDYVVWNGYIENGDMYVTCCSKTFYHRLDAFRCCSEYLAGNSYVGICYSDHYAESSSDCVDFKKYICSNL